MNVRVLGAIFRRNFVSYFSNPTGYVFICVFVALSSFATFWPDAFFEAGLANLDQLNHWFPWIMLVFVPAVTMGLWAQERQESTDELLLTIPANDSDVVLGKYLAAVAIYSVALGFATFSNFVLLESMGNPDFGLFAGNSFGYWMVGVAMLAVGMIASFLTSNLTLAFVLGAMFNVPLVLFAYFDPIAIQRWSIAYQLRDLGLGMLQFSSIVYFAMIAVVGFYVSLVLIGRRHWLGGRDGRAMIGHYIGRALALVGIAIGAVVFCNTYEKQFDLTSNGINTLSDNSVTMVRTLHSKEKDRLLEKRDNLEKLDDKASKEKLQIVLGQIERLDRPIRIDAYISDDVPRPYVRKRKELITVLMRLQSISGGKIKTAIHSIEPYSEKAEIIRKKHGIEARNVGQRNFGSGRRQKIFLGAVFTFGGMTKRIDFFELGIPIEYELMRTLSAVARHDRKTVGVICTAADITSPQGPFGDPNEALIGELRKLYNVEKVDPSEPIALTSSEDEGKPKYDVLLVIQPSAMPEGSMNNLVAAIENGIPAAIFEDPHPYFLAALGPTNRNNQRNSRRPPPGRPPLDPPATSQETHLGTLLKALGIELVGKTFDVEVPAAFRPGIKRQDPVKKPRFEAQVVWQDFNPYANLSRSRDATRQWLFIREAQSKEGKAFSNDEITKDLHELFFLFSGAIRKADNAPEDL